MRISIVFAVLRICVACAAVAGCDSACDVITDTLYTNMGGCGATQSRMDALAQSLRKASDPDECRTDAQCLADCIAKADCSVIKSDPSEPPAPEKVEALLACEARCE